MGLISTCLPVERSLFIVNADGLTYNLGELPDWLVAWHAEQDAAS